jgi:hypothetical protein
MTAINHRRPGRPPSGQKLVRTTVMLREDQCALLKAWASQPHFDKEFESISGTIRTMIDTTFPRGMSDIA